MTTGLMRGVRNAACRAVAPAEVWQRLAARDQAGRQPETSVVSLLRRNMRLGVLSGAQANDEGNILECLLFKATATLNEVPTIADVNDGSDHPRSSVLRAMQGGGRSSTIGHARKLAKHS